MCLLCNTPLLAQKEAAMGSQHLRLPGVHIGLKTYLDDFKRHLLPDVKPKWADLELDYKVFDTGITNFLVAIFDKSRGLHGSGDDVVLLRINGAGTELIIDRVDEIESILLMNEGGMSKPLYAVLGNGLCYGYAPGRQLAVSEVSDEVISVKIARLMARVHSLEIKQHFQGRQPQVWAKVTINYSGVIYHGCWMGAGGGGGASASLISWNGHQIYRSCSILGTSRKWAPINVCL